MRREPMKWYENKEKSILRILAPMVSVSSLPFRTLALKNGADVVFTEELVSKRLALCKRIEENDIVKYVDGEDVMVEMKISQSKQTVLQLGTYDVESSIQSVQLVKEICGVDINLGCGKGFSVKGCMGQPLALNREKLQEIIKALTSIHDTVSCKIRLQDTTSNTIEFIKWLYSQGISIITLHGRRHNENYNKDSDYEELQRVVKGLVNLPIILNGDICTQHDIQQLSTYGSNVKGVMIGRAAGCYLGIFRSDGGEYEMNETRTKTFLCEFLLEAHKHQMSFKKIKSILIMFIRYQREYPFGSYRKSSSKRLIQLNTDLASSKSLNDLIKVVALDNTKNLLLQSPPDISQPPLDSPKQDLQ
ncbi:Dihydrouridine synthase (Dus) family protein [Entamoeba marina]